ncbi:MAG: putative MaoC-like dehydratase [Myxococcales bacterium]|nr:putative MaoC-like dehydratase [Myxococcales bacterium]
MDLVRNPDVGSLVVGRAVAVPRLLTQEDFYRFARLSGDDNPIHVDPDFCAGTRWGRTLAHGMLLYSLIIQTIRTELLPGAIELEQDLMFPGPTFADEVVIVHAEVVKVDRARNEVEVRARVTRPDGGIGCEGRTLVRTHV